MSVISSDQLDELESVIVYLDTCYDANDPCIVPQDAPLWLLDQFGLNVNNPVSDPNYDAIRLFLKYQRPNSDIFKTATASKFSTTAIKVKHPWPLVSIEKAYDENLLIKSDMLFKWIVDRMADVKYNGLVFDLEEKELPSIDPKTMKENGKKQHPSWKYKKNIFSYPREMFSMSRKWDGLALALYYENGKLVKAGLRSSNDPSIGDDVTEQAKYVEGIPQQLKLPLTLSVRGEVVCKLSNFPAVNTWKKSRGEKEFENARGAAVGGMRQFNDPTLAQYHKLTFSGYDIQGLANPPYKTEIERAKWANKELGIFYVRTESFNFYTLADLEANAPYVDYQVDGIVISVDNLEDQENMGRHGDAHTGNPKGKIAWKFAEKRESAIVKEIEWNTGRTGVIKPVAIFDSIRLAGTNVTRATLHNLGVMIRNGIDVGTEIEVLKAGSIIPKIVGVKNGKLKDGIWPKYPINCPSCGGKNDVTHTDGKYKKIPKDYVLEHGDIIITIKNVNYIVIQEEMWELICTNDDCSAKKLNNYTHFLDKIGILGLGDVTVGKLIDGGKLLDRSDFYNLTVQDCEDCGLSYRQSLLAVANVWMVLDPESLDDSNILSNLNVKNKIKVSMGKFFSALGIPTAGKSTGKGLSCFGDWNALENASVDELCGVEGVGEKTALIIHDYLNKHSNEIHNLLNFIELDKPKTGKLLGKKFCLSGSFDGGKDTWEKQIENAGGEIAGSVSKKLSYLVAGPGSEGKSIKAKDLGIPIIDIDYLKKML
jgi:DNA ligase (NAD+)